MERNEGVLCINQSKKKARIDIDDSNTEWKEEVNDDDDDEKRIGCEDCAMKKSE